MMISVERIKITILVIMIFVFSFALFAQKLPVPDMALRKINRGRVLIFDKSTYALYGARSLVGFRSSNETWTPRRIPYFLY